MCAVLANIHRGPDSDEFRISDFMPMKPEDLEEIAAEKQAADQRKLAAAFERMAAVAKFNGGAE